MGKSKKRRRPPRGVWELGPSDPRRLDYEQQTGDWHRAHPGATVTEMRAAWNRIAKRLRLRAPSPRGGPTDEQVAIPKVLSIPPEHRRDESREESASVKRRLRSGGPVTWQVMDAAGHVWEEQHPLPPLAPSPRSGRPSSTLTDEALRDALKAGRTTRELAEQFTVTPRTIQRHRKTLPQLARPPPAT